MSAVRGISGFGLSYRDLDELLAELGSDVDHVTLYRWVRRFTPLLINTARPSRHTVGSLWLADETCVRIAGVWSGWPVTRGVVGGLVLPVTPH